MNKIVYFMRPEGQDGPIKIGCSTWPEKRLRTLAIWSPAKLEIVASAPGAHREENALHWMFRDERLHGEWFAASPALLALIGLVKRDGKLPDIPRNPHRHKAGAKRNNGRAANPEWTRAKSRLTFEVCRAERHAFSYWREAHRPQWVKDAIASYTGTFTPPPTPEVVAELRAYAADLRSRPKVERSFAAWKVWQTDRRATMPTFMVHNHRLTPHPASP